MLYPQERTKMQVKCIKKSIAGIVNLCNICYIIGNGVKNYTYKEDNLYETYLQTYFGDYDGHTVVITGFFGDRKGSSGNGPDNGLEYLGNSRGGSNPQCIDGRGNSKWSGI